MTDSTLDLVVNPLSRWVRRGRLHELCRSLEAAGTTPTVTIPGSSEEAAEDIESIVEPGDTLLIKGSRGIRMERLARALLDAQDEEHS